MVSWEVEMILTNSNHQISYIVGHTLYDIKCTLFTTYANNTYVPRMPYEVNYSCESSSNRKSRVI